MNCTEIPVAFDCDGAALIGIIHRPEQTAKRGVLAIVAGGPQYRAGCCRQLIQMARTLSASGTPVMRFDYRGLGDSAGQHKGFESIGPELEAAIATFRAHVPGMQEVILWGGCDAASASMIHGPNNPAVSGMILANPYVHSEEIAAKAIVKHYYLRRLRDRGFWQKVLRFEFNPLTAASSLRSTLAVYFKRGSAMGDSGTVTTEDTPFPERMLRNMQRFDGKLLLMMSGLSIESKEFDELVKSSAQWRELLERLEVDRVDFPRADQAFSTIDARFKQIAAAEEWLVRWT